MANRRLIFAAALLLLIAIFVFWVHSLPPRAPRQSISFPGGSKITFAGTTYGKPALPPTGSWTRNFAFLPDSFLRLLKINPGRRVTLQTNHLAVWFFSSGTASTGSFPFPDTTFSLVDENGVECFSPDFSFAFSSYKAPDGSPLQGIDLGAFPRRGKIIRFRVYSRSRHPVNKLIFLGEMSFPNPAFRAYPEWQPAALPAAQTNRGVTVTLTRLETGTSPFNSMPANTNQETWGNAFLTLTEAGKPCRDWVVDTVEFSDATGNRAHPTSWGTEEPKVNRQVFRFCAPLWPAESAWKLAATFRRRPDAKFADNELWIVTNLSLPELNSTSSLTLETNLHGANLKILSVTDESSTLPEETLKDHRQVSLNFQVTALPATFRFDIFGSAGVNIRNQASTDGSQIKTYGCSYLLPASARTLDAKVAVYQPLTAEFIVKPALAAASNLVPAAPK